MFVSFGMAEQLNGDCILRFDDTNPEAEKQEYIDHIQDIVSWMGWTPSKVPITPLITYGIAVCTPVTSTDPAGVLKVTFSNGQHSKPPLLQCSPSHVRYHRPRLGGTSVDLHERMTSGPQEHKPLSTEHLLSLHVTGAHIWHRRTGFDHMVACQTCIVCR